MKDKIKEIPTIVMETLTTLTSAGFEAYLVGGCVRDLLLGIKPKDWDITTNANPEEIQRLYKKTVYENKYGTVGVINESVKDITLREVQITPYRTETTYSDKRRPDNVVFTMDIKDDLKRRDFTINAMALSLPNVSDNEKSKGQIGYILLDIFNGQKDLAQKIIHAVGNPKDRFNEDALRMLRAVRLASELGFKVSHETENGIKENAKHIKEIAPERIKDELAKIIMSFRAGEGIRMMQYYGLLEYIMPELEEGIGIEQNKAHKFTVWDHNIKALEHAASKEDWPLGIRLAALLHDVGKPNSRRWSEEKGDWTFYGHDVIGAKMATKMLARLKFSKDTIDLVAKFVRHHLFFSDTEKITLSAVRRTVRNVGKDHVWDLMKVRFADRIGMGRPKETPYRLRKYEAMIEEAMRSPLSVTALKIDGQEIMKLIKINPGPKIGYILHILLDEVLDDPEKNTTEYLQKRTIELGALVDKELEKIGKAAKERKDEEEAKEIKTIRQRWWVK